MRPLVIAVAAAGLVAAGCRCPAEPRGAALARGAGDSTESTLPAADGGAPEMVARVAALRARVNASPKQAAPRIELARLLLGAGLGESARREAEEAVRAEPANAGAHLALGEVLMHDAWGRRLRPGFEWLGAGNALQRARELLVPGDPTAALLLAELWRHGTDGAPYGATARVSDAIAILAALKAGGVRDAGEPLAEALFATGQLRRLAEWEAREGLGALPAQRILAAAALSVDRGPQAALDSLTKNFLAEALPDALGDVVLHLTAVREYAHAAALLAAAIPRLPDHADELKRLHRAAAKLRRTPALPPLATTPEAAVLAFRAGMMTSKADLVGRVDDADLVLMIKSPRGSEQKHVHRFGQGRAILVDTWRAAGKWETSRHGEDIASVTIRAEEGALEHHVVRTGGVWRLVLGPAGLARRALRSAALQDATRWVTWAWPHAEGVREAFGEVARLDARGVRWAAAALFVDKHFNPGAAAGDAKGPLQECAASAGAAEVRSVCARALANMARAAYEARPPPIVDAESPTAKAARYARLGRVEQAQGILAADLDAWPGGPSPEHWRAKAAIAETLGELDDARAAYARAVTSGSK